MIKVTTFPAGFMLLDTRDGVFKSKTIEVPESWHNNMRLGNDWLQGLTMDLQVKAVGGKHQVVFHVLDGHDDLVIDCSNESEAQSISDAIKHLWLEANGLADAAPVASAPSRAEPIKPVARASSDTAAVQAAGNGDAPKSKKKMAVVTLACVAVLAAAGFGSYKFMAQSAQPLASAPALDLTKMSVDDIAKIDADPKFVQSIQQEMMNAVTVGKEAARAKQTEIEASHIEALKDMGLDPGTSMKSAAACLAAM